MAKPPRPAARRPSVPGSGTAATAEPPEAGETASGAVIALLDEPAVALEHIQRVPLALPALRANALLHPRATRPAVAPVPLPMPASNTPPAAAPVVAQVLPPTVAQPPMIVFVPLTLPKSVFAWVVWIEAPAAAVKSIVPLLARVRAPSEIMPAEFVASRHAGQRGRREALGVAGAEELRGQRAAGEGEDIGGIDDVRDGGGRLGEVQREPAGHGQAAGEPARPAEGEHVVAALRQPRRAAEHAIDRAGIEHGVDPWAVPLSWMVPPVSV